MAALSKPGKILKNFSAERIRHLTENPRSKKACRSLPPTNPVAPVKSILGDSGCIPCPILNSPQADGHPGTFEEPPALFCSKRRDFSSRQKNQRSCAETYINTASLSLESRNSHRQRGKRPFRAENRQGEHRIELNNIFKMVGAKDGVKTASELGAKIAHAPLCAWLFI
jgi:hypothetical protein